MSLTALFAGDFDTYFKQAGRKDLLWLFVHVPKTAGSSLNGELMPILVPNMHIFMNYTDPSLGTYEEQFDRGVDSFIAKAVEKPFRYATGHINGDQVDRIVHALPATRPITIMRDPLARFVSDYRYQCSPLHPPHEAFKAEFPTIEHYSALPWESNKAATHLVPEELVGSADSARCVEYVAQTYSFVGIQESYALALRVMAHFAGVAPRRPRVFKRVNKPTSETAVDLSAALEAQIREKNKLDYALYDFFEQRFGKVEEDLEAYLDEVAPLP